MNRHARPSRTMYVRRRIMVFGGALLVLVGAVGATGYSLHAAAAELPEPDIAVTAPAAPESSTAELDWPPFRASAIGAVGFDGVLAETGTTESVPIASITKIITALVILEAKPIKDGTDGPTIEFTDHDEQIFNEVAARAGSRVDVYAGLRLTEREALATMLIPSANNYAISLTDWAFGSQHEFLTAARQWLDDHGFTETRLADSAGLNPGSVSSPSELLAIGKLAVEDPVLGPIVAAPQMAIPGLGTKSNTNEVLGVVGINGIKTGSTDEAGHCLLFSATQTGASGDTVQLVGVVLGADSYDAMWNWVPRLVSSAEDDFSTLALTSKGTKVGSVTTAWGERSPVVVSKDASVLIFAGTPVEVTVATTTPESWEKGTVVGKIEYTAGTDTVTVPLVTASAIAEPDFFWRLTHPEDLQG